MNSRLAWLKSHPLVLFFVLAYAITWAIWAPLLASAQGILERPPSPYLHLLGGIGPMLAALIVTGITTGKVGVGKLLRRMVHWRVGLTWHLIAWLSPAILFLFAAVIVRVAWGAWPDFIRFGQSEEFPNLPLLVYWAMSILFYGWGEETGWRGFALPRLQKGRSAWIATLLLSIFWATWHLPLFWFVDGFMKMGVGGAIGWYFSILSGAVLFTWLYNSTKGSILITAIFHGMVNIVFTSPSPGDLAAVTGVLMMLWSIIVLIIEKPATLSRSRMQVIES